MRSPLLLATLAALLPAPSSSAPAQLPAVDYTLRVDTARLDDVDVSIRIAGAPSSVRLAMKVHPEYDAKYWRHLDGLRVTGSADDARASVTRLDSTLWRVTLPGGHGTVHYRIHVQPQTGPTRRAWMPFVRATGGLINGPDLFLYLPDFARTPVTVRLDVPRSWRAATSLARTRTPNELTAPDAEALLDSPILLGDLHEWTFDDRGARFHVAYWPLPNAAPFDTTAFVSGVRRLVGAALDIFGGLPSREFWFLLQDGAGDALEHRASVAFGLPSAELARDPHARAPALAHEFFHTWNLVAIHPDAYGALDYRAATPTSGLWWGEGVTLYYADALVRRSGLADSAPSRLDHLRQLLTSYLAAPWRGRASPERASLAFGASPLQNADATGSYYLQGELLAHELDALLRDSTHERRGLDDVMRALFADARHGRGFTSASLEHVVDSVCACSLDAIFTAQVRGASPIDPSPTLARLGLRALVDTALAADSTGAPLPDTRVSIDFTREGPPLALVLRDTASTWRTSGLRTGDLLVALGDTSVASAADFFRALRGLRVGDTAVVNVRRESHPLRVRVPITSYQRPRVRFIERPDATAAQRARRARWLAGW